MIYSFVCQAPKFFRILFVLSFYELLILKNTFSLDTTNYSATIRASQSFFMVLCHQIDIPRGVWYNKPKIGKEEKNVWSCISISF